MWSIFEERRCKVDRRQQGIRAREKRKMGGGEGLRNDKGRRAVVKRNAISIADIH